MEEVVKLKQNLFEQRYTILLLLATHSYDHNKTTSSVK